MTRSRKATSAAALAQSLASRDCVLSLARRHPFLPPPSPSPKNVATPAGQRARARYFLATFLCTVHTHKHDYRPPNPPRRLLPPTRHCSSSAHVWRDFLRVKPGSLSRSHRVLPCAHPHIRSAAAPDPVQSHRNGRTRPILHKRACPTACCHMLRLYYDGLLRLHATTQVLKENVERTRTWCREGVHLVNDWEDGSQYR